LKIRQPVPAVVRYFARLARFHARQIRAAAHVEGDLASQIAIVVPDLDRFTLGRGSVIGSFGEINVTTQAGGSSRSGLFIGKRTTIGTGCNIRGSGGIITIGDDVRIGQQVSIIAADHSFAPDRTIRSQPWSTDRVDVTIEDDVFIGCGVQIMAGSILRRGCVVAAGAVVRDEIPPYAIAAGVPARVLGSRHDRGAS
jgi:acetyltransferase-like isoleucine patch superfamily enzyme